MKKKYVYGLYGKKLAVALTVCMLAGCVLPFNTVYALESGETDNSEVIDNYKQYGDFEYQPYNDGVEITGYKGKLSEVVIPSEIDGQPVRSIGCYVFSSDENLTTVTVPNSVIAIDENAFSYCTKLTNIYVAENSESFCSQNGVLFSKDKTWLVKVPAVTAGEFVVPNSVTAISSMAFKDCADITSVIMHDKITHIGQYVFSGCNKIKNITIPAGVETIEEDAFWDCGGLENIDVDEANTHYTSQNGILMNKSKTEVLKCPENKSGILVLPNSVKMITYRSFYGCTGLKSIFVPESVTEIEAFAFEKCSDLILYGLKGSFAESYATETGMPFIAVSEAPTEDNFDENMFKGFEYQPYDDGIEITGYKGKLSEVVIPSEIGGQPVRSIGYYAFSDDENLTSITIPNSVTALDGGSFSFCLKLENIYVDEDNKNFCSQNGVLFSKDKTILVKVPCAVKGEFVVPESVTKIGFMAFADCEDMTSVIIHDKVTYIGQSVLFGCTGIKNITIPAKVEMIEPDAFLACSSLENIYVDEANTHYASQSGILLNKNKTEVLRCPENKSGSLTLPNSVKTITFHSFYGCTSLKSIVVPESVTEIEDFAFQDCGDLTLYGTKGSFAESYATKMGMTFIATDEPSKPESSKPSTENSSVESTKPSTENSSAPMDAPETGHNFLYLLTTIVGTIGAAAVALVLGYKKIIHR